MSLITLPAFLRRHREDSPMPEIVTTETTATPAVLMRFLTQGGAVVELHKHTYAARTDIRGYALTAGERRTVDGVNWRCLGCGSQGGQGRYGFGPGGYEGWDLYEPRSDANEHASACRAMPKPQA
ncbi:hypothetical protein AB0451_03265 [Streptomyces sp. NPDC052000]|uniref:hypothetical protein n=1 Tax=Streptomyces sp. NPDC052000 TaxID=3155676 RepID=UPI00344C8DCE